MDGRLLDVLKRYGVAVALPGAAVILRGFLPFPEGAGIYQLPLAAVVLSAWYGGRGPGWLASAISVLGAMYLLPPEGSFALHPEHALPLSIFAVLCLLLTEFSAGRRRVEHARRESEARFRTLVEFSFDVYWESDAKHRFTRQEFTDHLGNAPPGSELGKARWEVPYLEPDEEAWRKHRATMDAHLPFRDFELARPTPDGGRRYVSVSGMPMFDDFGQFVGYRGVGRDVTQRKRTEALLAGEKRILEMAAQSVPLAPVLDTLCRLVEEQVPGTLASVLLVEGNRMRHGGAPSLPKPFTQAIDGLAIGPAAGSCGTAAHRGERVVVRDIESDPLWADYRAMALPHGLRACWSTPIRSAQGKVIGTLAMYYREARAPTARDEETIERISYLAGAVIQHRVAAEALRESEARFRKLTELSADWYWKQDENLRFTVAMDDKAGFAPVSLGKARWELPITPLSASWDEHRAVLAARKPFRNFEYSRIDENGAKRYISVNGMPVFDEQGAFKGYDGVASDITPRKTAEQALSESEARFRKLTELSADGYWRQDENLRFIYSMDERHGFENRSLGKARWELPFTPLSASWDEHRAVLMARKPFRDFEYLRVHPDGTTRHITVSGVPAFDDQGVFKGYDGVATDITPRKAAEEELRRRERELAAVIETMPVMAFVTEADGSGAVVNRRWSDYTGFRPEGDNWRSAMHPEDLPRYSELRQATMASGEPFETEMRLRRADGEHRWFLARAVALRDEHGKIMKWYGALTDIEDRKRAEEQLAAHVWFLESMDRINRALQGTNDLEKMMNDVLDAALEIFACDRAWLLHPCDPEAPSWRAVMEHTRPEYPGVFALGAAVPTDSESAKLFAAALGAHGPLALGPGDELQVPADIAERFTIRSAMAIALRPKGDRPYLFGLHQCSHPRTWTKEEQRLFEEIGHRLNDALGSLIAVRGLRESEARLEAAQSLAHVGWWERDYATGHVFLSDEACRIFGVQPLELPHWHGRWLSLIHPDDRPKAAEATERSLRGEARYDLEYRVVRPDGTQRVVHSQGDVTRDETGRAVRQFGVLQDITELRQTERRLEAAQRVAHVGWWERDYAGGHMFLSDEVAEIFGIADRPRIIDLAEWKKLLPGIIHPEDYRRVLSASEASLRGGPRYDIEYRVVHRDGTVRIVHSQADVTLNESAGAPVRQFGVSQDITELRQAEVALRESEQRYRTLFEKANDAIFLENERDEIVEANERACALLGYSREELLRMKVPELQAPEVRGPVGRVVRDELERHGSATFETVDRHRSGRPIPVEVTNTGIAHGGGKLVLSVVRDMTERKRAEEALRASEARFRTFVDHATDAFFLHDDQLIIVDVNRKACESLGYTREELVGMHPRRFDATLDEASMRRFVERVVRGETITFETLHRRKDGIVFPVEVRASEFAQGERRLHISLVRDISERKLAEETLRGKDRALDMARTELARVSRLTTLGELTTSIAHEVSQPLGAMMASAAACSRWLAARPPEMAEARAALENIAADGKRAREVIGRIRALTKRQPPRTERLDLNQKIADVLQLTDRELSTHGVVLRTELDDTLPRVAGDRVQLQQVLLNLILNAVEAMSGVEDRPRELTIRSRPEGANAVMVEVRDSGTGVDTNSAERLFESFYTTKSEGLGIGLSISRSIVEAHGGRLSAARNSPHGAVFRFSLPVAGEEQS